MNMDLRNEHITCIFVRRFWLSEYIIFVKPKYLEGLFRILRTSEPKVPILKLDTTLIYVFVKGCANKSWMVELLY